MKYSKRSYATMAGLHPLLIWVLMEAANTAAGEMEVAHGVPMDWTLTDGLRTTAQQKEKYAQGRTAPGEVVTNADGVRNKSAHQAKDDGFGYAVDLYPFMMGKVQLSGQAEVQVLIARHILATAKRLGVPLVWGGNWKGKLIDRPHFELNL